MIFLEIRCSSFRYLPGWYLTDILSQMKYLPLAFSSVNWCKIDVFTSNIIVLHHKISQTVKIKVNRCTNIYLLMNLFKINQFTFIFFLYFSFTFIYTTKIFFVHFVFLLLLIVWDFLWCCHDLEEILWVPNFYYYICQICCLRLGLRSSGFTHDWLQAPSILIVIRVVQSTLMN